MKNLHKTIFIGFAALTMSFYTNAQAFENVKTAIKIGSSKELSSYFDNNVEISLDGKTANYSKAQSEFVIKDFFKKNPPKDFKIIHNGTSEGGLKYAIGSYISNSTFRVLIRMKDNKIYNLSFSKE